MRSKSKKMAQFTLKELTTAEEMLLHIEVLQELYPHFTLPYYQKLLEDMLPHRYKQLAVFEGEVCVGICGFWLGTKLWCGKYLELDNIVVRASHRSKGVGAVVVECLTQKGIEEGCSMLALDSYTDNFAAHKFFYLHGFVPRGFHFIKKL